MPSRLVAAEVNTTKRPLALMRGDLAHAVRDRAVGRDAHERRGVRDQVAHVDVRRSAFVSCGNQHVELANATRRPLPLIDGLSPPMSASAPVDVRLTRFVVFVTRSRTKTSVQSFVSPGHQPGRVGLERDVAAVAAQRGHTAVVGALVPVRLGRDPRRQSRPCGHAGTPGRSCRSRRGRGRVPSETNATKRPSPLIAGVSAASSTSRWPAATRRSSCRRGCRARTRRRRRSSPPGSTPTSRTRRSDRRRSTAGAEKAGVREVAARHRCSRRSPG